MYGLDSAPAAYAAPDSPTRTPRNVEYDLFARTTHRLSKAAGASGRDFPALARALHANRRLWITLAADVASDGNRLPRQLRAQLFYLAEFVEAHSRKILAGEGDAQVLVEINTSVMRGLRAPGDAS
ncbi:flagellar biosynthesis regulator FlhF [Rhodobacteraceae bacterium WD3A24]|nr:flagellar biosynthesis regulator FlhF [Rhodobacteraceae bacterium WD3A24]